MEASYKNMIRRAAEALKPLGYKKKGYYLVATRPDGNHGLITFITDPSLSQKELGITHFTGEIAVASKKLLDRFRRQLCYSAPEKPSPRDNHYSSRFGYLAGYERDFWWDIGPQNEESVIAEILDVLKTGVEKIEKEISDEAICAQYLRTFENGFRQNPAALLQLAYLLYEFGDTENFNKVAEYTTEKFGERPSVKEFYSDLGFMGVTRGTGLVDASVRAS